MKIGWLILAVILLFCAIVIPVVYNGQGNDEVECNDFFFGVSFGGTTASQAKQLIDKVKDYTNLFIINSWEVVSYDDDSMLNEISQYAVDADMSFMVFFDFISRKWYPWHQTWLDTVEERFGDKFLGVYLYDEPGGKQIDSGYWKGSDNLANLSETVSDYSGAAELFLTGISSLGSTLEVKQRNMQMFTSDFALYWFDYLAGYDSVFVELGWNNSRTRQIALCRGAANVQDKDWGAIITWTYNDPPYLENGTALLEDLTTAYRAGAKYVIVFNYPYDETYGILEEEHFSAMETFWSMTKTPEGSSLDKIETTVAFVLPKDYGWGLRRSTDRIWFPVWGPDELSSTIWNNLNQLIDKYGFELDVIYDDPAFSFEEKYSTIYYWNSQID